MQQLLTLGNSVHCHINIFYIKKKTTDISILDVHANSHSKAHVTDRDAVWQGNGNIVINNKSQTLHLN